MTKTQEVVTILGGYLELFPQKNLSTAGLTLYAEALAEYTPQAVGAAMRKLVKTSKFFPTVAEIVEAVEELRDFYRAASGQGGKPTAAEAWQEAWQNAKENFVYKPWKFSCEEVKLATEQFGKMQLCELTPDGMNTARAQFMKIYDSVLKKGEDKRRNREVFRALGVKMPPALAEKIKQIGNGGLGNGV